MIKSNDLRIGNILEIGGYYIEVLEVYINSVKISYLLNKHNRVEFLKDRIKPIPLTEEILLKIKGISIFKWRGIVTYSLNENSIDMGGIGSVSSDLLIIEKDGIYEVDSIEIEYLHDLQNIAYYKLNKQELQIEL